MVGAHTPVDSIRQIQVTDFLRDICRLPLDWSTRFDKGTATVAQMLAEGTDKGMSPTTWAGSYQAPLKAFLRDARRDYGDDGFPALIVDGIKYVGSRVEDEEKQRSLTVPELRTFFEGPDFATLARQPEGESLYWFSLVALFTGARPREICQINPQCDFGEEGGIHYLDFDHKNPAGAGVVKTIKTGEERRIPLHPELVRLGFPAHLKHLKDTGADRLFPSMRVKKGNPFEVLGEQFSELLKTMGLYDNTAPPGRLVLGAYVLRKAFITQASNQRVVSREITGHSADTRIQRESYIDGPEPLEVKHAELSKLALPLKVPLRGRPTTDNTPTQPR